MRKYVIITSGVCSGLGKGVATAAIGSLLECRGLKVAMVKCDPYINVDSGNISPYQNGEVYVTDDGAETDFDMGTFSRFTGTHLTGGSCITTGKVYEAVIRNERAGLYNGRLVRVIPHITDEIKRRILAVGTHSGADVVVVEIGGTVGDMESVPYLEASRQLIHELGKNNSVSIHMTLVPAITGGELKTKPTQHAVKQLQEVGIQSDILLCRSESPLNEALRKKVALFCNVSPDAVFTSCDVEKSVYELPILFHNEGLDGKIIEKLAIKQNSCDISAWNEFIDKMKNPKAHLTVAMVGKRDYLDDFYKSVKESLFHAAVTVHRADLSIKKIDAEELEHTKTIGSSFKDVDGIIIPGNCGQRGFMGLLSTVKYARENKIPYLGIDIGMQLMAIEIARNVLDWRDADSTEFMRRSSHAVISLPEEQMGLSSTGLMKLGAGTVKIASGTKLFDIYSRTSVSERHRSKYTFDRRYADDMAENGLVTSAVSVPDGQTESFEWINHPFGIGVQFHPEFTSRPSKPHPLFSSFIAAILNNKV